MTVLTKKHSGSELQQRSSTFDGKNGEVMETVSTPPRPVGSVANFRIRVKIQDGPMLLIPIAPQYEKLFAIEILYESALLFFRYIIKDLMDAVIKRHYSRELRTPQVKLVFDEAELCDEDVISDVLQNNDASC